MEIPKYSLVVEMRAFDCTLPFSLFFWRQSKRPEISIVFVWSSFDILRHFCLSFGKKGDG